MRPPFDRFDFLESTCGPNCDCNRTGRTRRLSGLRAEPSGLLVEGNMGALVDHGNPYVGTGTPMPMLRVDSRAVSDIAVSEKSCARSWRTEAPSPRPTPLVCS